MTPQARLAAAIEIFDGFLLGQPADKLLANWARANRYAGSKDRAAVRDIVFDGLRNLRGFAHASGVTGGRGIGIGYCLSNGLALEHMFSGVGYGPAPLTGAEMDLVQSPKEPPSAGVAANLPDWLVGQMKAALGDGFAQAMERMAQRAPVDLRVNTRRARVAQAQDSLARDGVVTEPVADVSTGLRVLENPRRVAGSKAYQSGLVELQDAASQAIVLDLEVPAKARILDYCAGGGGKTLALAAAFESASVSAWDVEQKRLAPLKERAERAVAQVEVLDTVPARAKYDLVLVDAPCSGAGSWRRNPEGKWRLTQERLDALLATQQEVLNKASGYVEAGGTLVYVTCSVLEVENGVQVQEFLAKNEDFSKISDKLYAITEPGDGFYRCILKKQL